MRRGFILTVLLLLLAAGARAQEVPAPERAALRDVSVAEHRAHLLALQQQMQACGSDESACDAKRVGGDDHVLAAGAPYTVRYEWVRDLFDGVHDKKKHDDAKRQIGAAQARIVAELEEIDRPAPVVALPAGAETKRNAVLRRPEFRMVSDYSATDLLLAKVSNWLGRLFGGVARFGRRAPWVGPLIEWGILAIAAAMLLLWARRALDRQRLAVRLEGDGPLLDEALRAESGNWAEMAQGFAQKQQWRDAVHCLYWASISQLESRKAWRPNRTRTPREYLRLLEPESSRLRALSQQTLAFERIWYGLNEARSTDYAQALAQYNALAGGGDARAASA